MAFVGNAAGPRESQIVKQLGADHFGITQEQLDAELVWLLDEERRGLISPVYANIERGYFLLFAGPNSGVNRYYLREHGYHLEGEIQTVDTPPDGFVTWDEALRWFAESGTRSIGPAHALPVASASWTPNEVARPAWSRSTRSGLIVARDLLVSGRLLSEMTPKHFEELIGALLSSEGWTVIQGRGSRDGGIDVHATLSDPVLGEVRSIWQAKKYSATTTVRLRHVRELAGIVDLQRATKGIIVTTSRLSRGAIDLVSRDAYRLGYWEGSHIEAWVRRVAFNDAAT